MQIQKFSGSAYSYFIRIGTTTFVYMTHEVYTKNIGEGMWGQTLPSTELTPLAFHNGVSWITSENPQTKYGRSMAVGIALNIILYDKKLRLKREDFIQQYKIAYSNALMEEANKIMGTLDD